MFIEVLRNTWTFKSEIGQRRLGKPVQLCFFVVVVAVVILVGSPSVGMRTR